MNIEQAKVGARVRLAKHIGGRYFGAMYDIDPGPIGVITDVGIKPPYADVAAEYTPYCVVQFEEHVPDLDTWDNTLHVFLDDDPNRGDATLSDFEVLS